MAAQVSDCPLSHFGRPHPHFPDSHNSLLHRTSLSCCGPLSCNNRPQDQKFPLILLKMLGNVSRKVMHSLISALESGSEPFPSRTMFAAVGSDSDNSLKSFFHLVQINSKYYTATHFTGWSLHSCVCAGRKQNRI